MTFGINSRFKIAYSNLTINAETLYTYGEEAKRKKDVINA